MKGSTLAGISVTYTCPTCTHCIWYLYLSHVYTWYRLLNTCPTCRHGIFIKFKSNCEPPPFKRLCGIYCVMYDVMQW